MLLYAITDRAWTGKQSLAEQVESALKGGATCVQLREKELSDAEFLASAIELSALCKRYGVPFFVNDNVEIAIECGADGVHVGQDDMAVAQVRRRVGDAMLIGVSAHSVEEALTRSRTARTACLGALFATNTKQGANVLPKEVLRDICAAVNVPVVAIGGIKKTNIAQLVGAGVAGVAVVSAIFSADDIESETRLLRQLSEEMVNA